MAAKALKVTLDQARAHWFARQGLGTPVSVDPVEVVERTGWVRTLGGADVYLSVRARCPGASRAALDDAAARGALRVAPAVRGCIYLVPERDVPVAMALADDLSYARSGRDLEKVGSSWAEVEALTTPVLETLRDGPKSTPGIRKALPDGAVRSFGDVGKKVGLSSPLPVALRRLEFRGEIERTLLGGGLDTERYEWRIPERPASGELPADAAGRIATVVRRYFEFFAPATLKEVCAWIGISQRDAKAAMADLALAPVDIEGRRDTAWIFESDRDALLAAERPDETVTFLPVEDNILTVYGGPGVWAEDAHRDLPVKQWGKSKREPLGKIRHLGSRPYFVGDRLAGLWEYDPDAGEVVLAPFDPDREVDGLDAAGRDLVAFIRDELGHARSNSIDSDDKLRKRARELREAAAA